MSDQAKGLLPWRVGSKVGRTIYDAHGNLIGVMDRQEDALAVVQAANGVLDAWRCRAMHHSIRCERPFDHHGDCEFGRTRTGERRCPSVQGDVQCCQPMYHAGKCYFDPLDSTRESRYDAIKRAQGGSVPERCTNACCRKPYGHPGPCTLCGC